MAEKQSFIIPAGKPAMMKHIETLKEGRWKVTFELIKPERSLGQNNYYWGYVVTPMADFCGFTQKEMHEQFLGDYFGWVEKSFRGHKWKCPRRTTTTDENGARDVLKGKEFRNFVENAERICAEMGVPIQFDEKQRSYDPVESDNAGGAG